MIFILKICNQVIIKVFHSVIKSKHLYFDSKLCTNEFIKDRKGGDLKF